MERTKFAIIIGVLITSLALLSLSVHAEIINVPDDEETIQDGINAAEDGDTVLVAPGEYVENIDFEGKDITVASLFLTTGEEAYIDSTVIDGDENGSVVTFANEEEEGTILSGFTVRNGAADRGAGIACMAGTSPILDHLIVRDNSGMSCVGIWCTGSSPTIQFVVVAHNIGVNASGIGVGENASPLLINTSVCFNHNEEDDGALHINDSHPIVANSIFWANEPYNISFYWGDCSVTVSYSDISGGRDEIGGRVEGEVNWGDGNIDEDPLLADPDEGDYHLTEDSPCIDTGDPDSPEDPDGTRADMGAYPFLQCAILEGFVFDATHDSPLENAMVMTSYGRSVQTDEDGFWRINNARQGNFDITASMQDFFDSTLTDLHVDADSTLEINFSLLHAECNINPDSVYVELLQNNEIEELIEVTNNGNGPLTYTVERRMIGEGDFDPWDIRIDIEAEEIVDDDQLNGVVVVDGLIYISGGNNGEDVNKIYVFNAEGDFLQEFDQFQESHFGMRDLTWDGNLIWGADETTLYGFNTDGELISTIEGQARSYRSMTWDPERDVFWSANLTSDIYPTNLNGQVGNEIEAPEDLRIYGLSYWMGDPDGYCLYVLSRGEEVDLQVSKINIDNGDVAHVRNLNMEGRPGGINISNQMDAYSWVLAGIVQSNPDRVVVWHLEGICNWLRIDPEAGQITAGDSEDLFLTLDATGLPPRLFEGELVFLHDGIGGETHVPVILNVVDELPNRPPSGFSLLEPLNGDTLNPFEVQDVTFVWGQSVDPDPDDVVTYNIWFQSGEDSTDISLQETTFDANLEVLADSLGFSLDMDNQLTWWVQALSDEFVVECNERFALRLLYNAVDENDENLPLVFDLRPIHPNPFNSVATITYSLPHPTDVTIRIYNTSGQRVLTLFEGYQHPGIHTTILTAADLPSGLYFVQLNADTKTMTRKVMLIR